MPTQGGGTPAKKPVKRGPTRAAALKALGLTASELADLRTAAKEWAEFKASQPAQTQPVEAAIPINTPDPQAALEERPLPKQEAWNAPDTEDAPVWYVRNLRGVDVGFRLSRQQKSDEKRTDLKPRGARGDTVRLQPGDLKDPELQTQVGYGLVEVIPEGEALAAIKKQYTNQQTGIPAHIAMLRNPKGEEYAQANPVSVASDEEAYGIKVADLNPDLMQGKLSDREIKRDGGFVQNAQHTPTGGNPAIISDGFMAAPQSDGSLGQTDQHSQDVDALARSKQFEGPGAGLGNVTVSVEPVRRVQ